MLKAFKLLVVLWENISGFADLKRMEFSFLCAILKQCVLIYEGQMNKGVVNEYNAMNTIKTYSN